MVETEVAAQAQDTNEDLDSPVIPLLRPKVRKACSECRRSKSKCEQAEWPCKRCKQRSLKCDLPQVGSQENAQVSTHSGSSARPLYCSVPRALVVPPYEPTQPTAMMSHMSSSPVSPNYSPVTPYPQERTQFFSSRLPQSMKDNTPTIYHDPDAMEYSRLADDHYRTNVVPAGSMISMPPSPTMLRPAHQGFVSQNYVPSPPSGSYHLAPSTSGSYCLSEDQSGLVGYAGSQRYHQVVPALPSSSSGRYQGVGYAIQEVHQNSASPSGLYYTAQTQPTEEHWAHEYPNVPDSPTRTTYHTNTYAYYPHGQVPPTPIDSSSGMESMRFYQEDRLASQQGPYPLRGSGRVLEGACDLQR
ncbi:hypothetical protein NEOLEDRAFT_1179142 [Neolentinus lepideus HHB14362 ss-1]|uniref:Zn(2)-C6 fungal-type domain-containing protein n=1 Tax=Neolentinus lepideus HHB14362 ss-1 TaxID=1314782 RepID=A0A165RZ57_9AGAM|nr:hypothetical protein NEOLEDRAFT_1179142 [Neolentinus lepideus HHB14362 ss-1]